MDKTEKLNKVKDLIAKGNLLKAIELYKIGETAQSDLLLELEKIEVRVKQLEQKNHEGFLTQQEYTTEQNKLSKVLLQLRQKDLATLGETNLKQEKRSHKDRLYYIINLLTILFLLAYLFYNFGDKAMVILEDMATAQWVSLILIYLLGLLPTGILIGLLTKKWKQELHLSGEETGLKNGGRITGYIERFLIITLVIFGQWTGAVILLALKIIVKLILGREKLSNKYSEYVLIGSLLSFSAAFGLGLLYRFLGGYF